MAEGGCHRLHPARHRPHRSLTHSTRAASAARTGERRMIRSSPIPLLAMTVALCLIIMPILVVVGVAFSAGDFFLFPPPGFSFRWFREFFTNDALMQAFR